MEFKTWFELFGLKESILFVIAIIIFARLLLLLNREPPFGRVPCPPRWGLLGHLPDIIMAGPRSVDLYDSWSKYAVNGRFYFDPLIGFRLVTENPDDVRKVLITCSHKFERTDAVKKSFKVGEKGIFVADRESHAWQRKMLNPMFLYGTIKGFVPKFVWHAERIVEFWADKIASSHCNEFEIEHDLASVTFDIICDTVLGYQSNSFNGDENAVTRTVEDVLKNSFGFSNIVINVLFPWVRYLPFGRFAKRQMASKEAKRIIAEVLSDKRRRSQTRPMDQDSSRDLLDLMMNLHDEETEETILADVLESNVWTFMVAGYDTTATTLTWILYALALHEDKQSIARQEVMSVLSTDSQITWESTLKLSYLNAVIKETLRLYCPVVVLPRQAQDDVNLGDITVTKGNCVLISVFRLLWSEKYWKDASKFVPERFLDTDSNSAKEKFSDLIFIPFGAGPSGCLGKRFAMLEMTIIMAKLIRKFHFSISPDHPKIIKKTYLVTKPCPTPRLHLEILH